MKNQERKIERIEHLRVEGEDYGKVLIDLSMAGAAFYYSQEIRAKSKISFQIESLLVEGIVIYCHKRVDDGYRVGMRFCNVSPEIQNELTTLVEDFSRGAMVSYKINREIDS